MLDIFDEIYTDDWKGIFSELYLVTFCVLFMYAALNIFIQIMEHAFNSCHMLDMMAAEPDPLLEQNPTLPGKGGDDKTAAQPRFRSRIS